MAASVSVCVYLVTDVELVVRRLGGWKQHALQHPVDALTGGSAVALTIGSNDLTKMVVDFQSSSIMS
jgi:hypothetical protein